MTEFIPSTNRVKKLLDNLKERALTNRSDEWFCEEDFKKSKEKVFEDYGFTNDKEYFKRPVIERKAIAIDIMLRSMTDPEVSKRTHTYEIEDGELIVGVMPMASNGLGKVFPNYLSEEEKRAASYTNKTELAILGHNTVNYEKLLSKGIWEIREEAREKTEQYEKEIDSFKKENPDFYKNIDRMETISIMQNSENTPMLTRHNELVSKREFYNSVKISCDAVINYMDNFAKLAEYESKRTDIKIRQNELKKIAAICNKLSIDKPTTFYEALQCVYFFHLAMHASMNLISLGRLDQSLYSFYKEEFDKAPNKQAFRAKATELFECFIIKCAGRLNLTTEFLVEQDHMDNNAALGVHPYYLDQRAGVNNFLQNIIIGGLTPDGNDAENDMTHIILNAYANVNLSTPGIYVRMGDYSSADLRESVAKCLHQTKNLPGILNDNALVPAIHEVLDKYETTDEGRKKAEKLANDYCVDGCWEPILNGECDWTFQMISCLNMFQCAINQGAVLDTNDGMLRGSKVSFRSPQVHTYKEFKESFKKYMQFFIDQAVFTMYDCYTMDEFVTPSPLFSAVLGQCMERGRDKSWGGTGMNIAGVILTGVPDTINIIAAFKKFVFEKQMYDIEEVKTAMVHNFKVPLEADFQRQVLWNQIKNNFDYNCAKFGDASDEIKEIGNFVLNSLVEIVDKSKEFSEKVFLNSLKDESPENVNLIRRLRQIAGYSGSCFKRKFGNDFCLRFTAGCGTFEGYPQQGLGVVATANRGLNDPLIANFSPAPGSIKNGIGNVFKTLSQLPMNKMSAGAITDLCINESGVDYTDVQSIIDAFISNNGCMMTLALGDIKVFQRMYDLSKDLLYGNETQKAIARDELPKYRDIVVRVGGWQAPFISMNLDQQANYIARFVSTPCTKEN
ncbi:pyruvate formate lyase family protein [Fibrobacter succinogenes]|uniref:pyruvate formate lyase family protein n=1 Tax=Fibrobacter succinogenes TaxID=833 RepID=UPI0015671731|nr:pyruvate formate lyase family protein [Fibrobacter succinogenes]